MVGKKLILCDEYTRREVYEIFDGVTPFTPGAGNWGLHGIIGIPQRENDFVFFVTFGQKELGHNFDENISTDGVLSWQSQPKQTLDNKIILKLIKHDHLINNIYLFLRTRKSNPSSKEIEPFINMGKLAYISHNESREKPVHFKWQLINWEDLNKETLHAIDLKLDQSSKDITEVNEELTNDTIIVTDLPRSKTKNGNKNRNYNYKDIDYIENQKKNSELGNLGEKLVLEYLINTYDCEVFHTSFLEGDGAGYDIEIRKNDGTKDYIEVKTTKYGPNSAFFLSANELYFSASNSDNYYLYRLYEYDETTNSAKLFILNGDLKESLNLNPINYKATLITE